MPIKLKDIVGQRFGRLVVISRVAKPGLTQWMCRCDCGSVKAYWNNRLARRIGGTKSCGCWSLERNSETHLIHGHSSEQVISGAYRSWRSMKARCSNPGNIGYRYYGAKGIKVCDEWLSFPAFLKDMGNRPKGFTLDRKDSEKDYCKDNCRWATHKQQALNRRSSFRVEFNGEVLSLEQAAAIAGLKVNTFRLRLVSGWSVQKAIQTPSRYAAKRLKEAAK